MSAEVFAFVCTETTAALSVPQYAVNESDHRRKVHNAFGAISGGFRRAGDIVFRFTPDAFDFHILADGSVYNFTQFPQLAKIYGGSFGGDGVTTFGVPNALDGITFASTAPTQTVSDGGTVSTGGTVETPVGTGQTGGTVGGNVSSGGRPRNPFEVIP